MPNVELLFIAILASHICKIMWNSKKIRTYSSSRSSKVINLDVIQKLIHATCLLVISHHCIRHILNTKSKKRVQLHQRQSLSVTLCWSIVWKDRWDSSWLHSLLWPNVAEIFIVKVFQTNHRILCGCQSQPVTLSISYSLANHCRCNTKTVILLSLQHTVHAILFMNLSLL